MQKKLNHNCMRDTCYLSRHVLPFHWLTQGLPRREGATDIDFFCEKNGSFLFIEAKETELCMPRGQQLGLVRLCDALGEKATLILAQGRINHYNRPPWEVERAMVFTSSKGWSKVYEKPDMPAWITAWRARQ